VNYYIKNLRCEFFNETDKIAFMGVSVEYEIKIKLNTKSNEYFNSRLPFEKNEKI